MSDYDRSRSYNYDGNDYRSSSGSNPNMMQLQTYSGPPRDFRSYSSSYADAGPPPAVENRDSKLKKGKGASKSMSFTDPEFQRRKRVASYKMYGVEGKMKGTFRKSLRWIKDRYSQVVYGWR